MVEKTVAKQDRHAVQKVSKIRKDTVGRLRHGREDRRKAEVAVSLDPCARTVVWTLSPNSARTGNVIITKRGQNG
jgi:hypothetical protein